MASTPVTVFNSLANLDEATAYFADSVRATSWDGLDPDAQSRNLITATRLLDRQRWEGTLSGLQIVRTAAVAAGGTGYAVGAILTVQGGTTEDPARVKVTAVSSGVVTAVQLVDAGGYTANPAGTAATASSGAGTGCTLTLTMGAQLLQLPRANMTDRYGAVVSSGVVPPEITQACLELALELVLDPTLEGQGSTATTSRKRVKAGSAEVENFAPGAFVPIERFPPSVMELIKPFLLGSGDAVAQIGASFASGTDAESAFDDCDGSNLTEGFG
jgi:hypothetical protein